LFQVQKLICDWLATLVRVKKPRPSSKRKQNVGDGGTEEMTSYLSESATMTSVLTEPPYARSLLDYDDVTRTCRHYA